MDGFLYTLTLKEPVLANSLSGEPNSAQSLFYIPGGLMRGAAINAYGKTKDANDDDFRRLFLDGSTRFLNAYPLAENGKPSSPTPVKFRKPKYFDASNYSYIENDQVMALEEEWQVNVHTQRDAELGHATSEAGAVYRYIALPAGMILQGMVITSTSDDTKALKDLLDKKNLLLGKARTAGYGHAVFEVDEQGALPTLVDTATSGSFTLTLLSPAIVRDEYGQATLDIQHALKARLDDKSLTVEEAFQKSEIVGGFNRTWGLPLPQVIAISAGSTFTVKTNVGVTKLQGLQATGLGERRSEGFGAVAVNLSLPNILDDDGWNIVSLFSKEISEKGSQLGNHPTAKLMVDRLAKRTLDQAVVHVAREVTANYKGNVPNSQLSRWRVITRDVLEKKNENGERDIQRLQTFMEDSKGKAGWQKMEKARVKIGKEIPRLTEWINDLLYKPDELQKALGEGAKVNIQLGSNSFTWTDHINLEYRLRLLDAVLAVMSKMNGGSNG